MERLGGEAQVAEDGTPEDIATGRAIEVVVAHILRPVHRTIVGEGSLLVGGIGELEQDHVGIVESHQVEAMLVGSCDNHIVAVDKLDVVARGHAESHVACRGESAIGLPQVEDVFGSLKQVFERTHVGTVVDDDDLSLGGPQGKSQDAVDAFHEQPHGQVECSNDERYFHGSRYNLNFTFW